MHSGASPGGWTQFLSSICDRVVAIDPGDLDEKIKTISNVVQIRALVQSSECKEYMNKEMSSKADQPRCGSLCVCDMNINAIEAVELIIEHVLPYIRKSEGQMFSSYIILTLKLPKTPRRHDARENFIKKITSKVIEKLECMSCSDFKIIHLQSNSANERTLACKY